MTPARKRFIQLWKRQRRNGVRLPAAFYFIRGGGHNEWRCFYGPVGKVRRSRDFIDHSAVYGFVSAKELLQTAGRCAVKPATNGNSRFIRSRIINRIKRPPLVHETRPTMYEAPAPATETVAAKAPGGKTISPL